MPDRDKGLSSQISFEGIISTLCETCERMAQTFRLGIDKGDVTREIDGLQTGAVARCPLCLPAWREVSKVRQRETTKTDFRITGVVFRFYNYYKHLGTFHLQITYEYTVLNTHVENVHVTLRLQPLLGLNLRTAQLAAGYNYPPSTGAGSVTKLIESWYLQCITEHQGCASQMSRYKPPRLVEVREDSFRIAVPSECEMMGPYATLSHCWGNGADFLKLSSSNFERLRQWSPSTWLPQTFQDATRLCYNLRIKYVWIDSLCILQEGEGSTEDWSRHVTEMRIVYSNGILNIAASHATSSNEGLYTVRNSEFIKPAVLGGNSHFGLSNEPHLLIDSVFTEPGESRPLLNERGWVFQERLLSQRVVHFEREQVFWECNDCALCETYPAGFNENFGRGYTVPPFTLPTKQTCSTAAERWNLYRRLVEHYYSLQFTFPNKDKLAAFSGIAEHISREFNDDYYAGMFRSQLPIALRWHAVGWYPKCDTNHSEGNLWVTRILPNNECHYPSWTWAKIHTDRARGVYSHYDFDPSSLSKHYVTLHTVETTPVDSQNIFGNLKSAHIILEGRLLPWVTEYEMPDRIASKFDGKAEACIDPRELFIVPFFAELRVRKDSGYVMFFLILHRQGVEKQESYKRVGTANLFRGKDAHIGEHKKGLTTIDEIFEADVVWREYLLPVQPTRILLI